MPQTIREVMTAKPVALQAGTSLVEAARAMREHDVGNVLVLEDDTVRDLMRDRAVRRLPVVESGRPVGIVSLGDLAVERDPASVLGTISAAQPNR